MNLNPFTTVSDYPTMLNKIAWGNFANSIACVWILRYNITPFDSLLSKLNIPVKIFDGFSLPLGTLILAIIIALISRAIKYHDKLSDLFQIRKRFDVFHILVPLAVLSNANCSVEKIESFRSHRRNLMNNVFYKYASSSPGKAKIETHYITMALDQWSWYWMLLEAMSLYLITSILLLFYSSSILLAYILLLFILVSVGCLQLLKHENIKYAYQELSQIIDNDSFKNEIAGVFNALPN
jgi:hypothetical protein